MLHRNCQDLQAQLFRGTTKRSFQGLTVIGGSSEPIARSLSISPADVLCAFCTHPTLFNTRKVDFSEMERPKRFLAFMLLVLVMCPSLICETMAKPSSQHCSSPMVQLYSDSDRCEGEFDSGPFFDSGGCPGNCSTVPNTHYSMKYKCGSQQGLQMLTSFTPSCNGPFSLLTVQSGRCSRLVGSSTSFAIQCDLNDPVLPPFPQNPTSLGNGTFVPALSACPGIDHCPPNMPYHTFWDRPNCQGNATSSSTFSNNALLNGCYFLPWPIDLNFRMTCPTAQAPKTLQFQIATSCETKPFVTLAYPTGVCINNSEGYGSSMYHCNDQPNFANLKMENQVLKPKNFKNSIGQVLKQHPLSKHNPILQALINTGI